MTTIVDPSGTPSVVYNKSGTTVVAVTAHGTDQTGAASIPRLSGVTVAVLSIPDDSNYAVKLPGDAEIGDVVEVYASSNFNVFADVGSTILGISSTAEVGPETAGMGFRFRKVGSSSWGAVGS